MYGEQPLDPGGLQMLTDAYRVPYYPRTPFNMARYSLHDGRSMVAGGLATGTPAKPWMDFQNNGWRYRNNDFYQELWLQLASSGVGQFFYFAPWEPAFAASIREHELVSQMLDEMTAVLGCADRRWIVDSNIRWQDSFLLSGSKVGEDNFTHWVWRYSPRDPTTFMPRLSNGHSSSSESSHAGPGNISIPVQLFLSGENRSCKLGFEQAVLRISRSSHFGWWIMQPDSAPPVGVVCANYTTTVWPLPHNISVAGDPSADASIKSDDGHVLSAANSEYVGNTNRATARDWTSRFLSAAMTS